ncbi:hypothetical protein ACEZDB_17540 [Streptacidiphilus sp. N1-3]|uniref:Uncharacterized protein n=1 Tax=Streptacidiphilus alkalitolerans TaxID=3342712 RepID=A0ABV6X2E3_9ACTN
MTVAAGAAWRRNRRWLVAAVATAVLLLCALWARGVFRDSDASAPSCSWSAARIEKADADQAGLIRCYLRAVAQHSDGQLRAVVRSGSDGPSGFSPADFAHTRDANSGSATVTVTGNDSDSADADVAIRYADGVRQQLEIHLADPASLHSWRFWNVGTYPDQG